MSVCFISNTKAQGKLQSQGGGIKFRSYNSVHLLNGSSSNSFLIQSVNGISWNKFYAGAGVASDLYLHTSFPVFLEGQYTLAERKNSLQLLADVGVNIPVQKPNEKFEMNEGPYKTGLYYNMGLQYEIPFKKIALITGAGVVYKQFIQMAENNTWNPSLNRVENIPIKKDYRLSRMYLKIGIAF